MLLARRAGSSPAGGTEVNEMSDAHTTRHDVQETATRRIWQLLEENDYSPTRVGRKLGVNKGLVCRVRDGGYSEMVCLALGLDIVKPVEMPICLECGEVHEIKATCDDKRHKQPRRRRKAADLDPDLWGKIQNYALDEIAAAYTGGKNWSGYVVQLAEGRIQEWSPEKFHRVFEEVYVE